MTLQIKTSTGWESIQHHGKNVIINGRLGPHGSPWIINQRGFDGNWDELADYEYGYDRWAITAISYIIAQYIENANILPNTDYVLKWDGGDFDATVQLLNGVQVQGVSPLIVRSGNDFAALPNENSITVDSNATNIQLELGTVPTPFEVRPIGLEEMLCKRYFRIGYIEMPYTDTISGNVYSAVARFNAMRVVPAVSLNSTLANRFPATSGSIVRLANYGFSETRMSNASGQQGYFQSRYAADAEIT